MSTNIKINNNLVHKNIEKTVCELLERYHPSSNILNMHHYHHLDYHNYDHDGYYVASDPIHGLVVTNCFNNFNLITHNDIDKLLSMKIHHSVLDHYNLETEEEVANFFHNTFYT